MSFRLRLIPAAILVAGAFGSAVAAELGTDPGQPLQAVLDRAQDGDVVRLESGNYQGPIRIERRIALVGRPGATISGSGAGNVITVTAPEVAIRGLTILGSGRDLLSMFSGFFLFKTALRAYI